MNALKVKICKSLAQHDVEAMVSSSTNHSGVSRLVLTRNRTFLGTTPCWLPVCCKTRSNAWQETHNPPAASENSIEIFWHSTRTIGEDTCRPKRLAHVEIVFISVWLQDCLSWLFQFHPAISIQNRMWPCCHLFCFSFSSDSYVFRQKKLQRTGTPVQSCYRSLRCLLSRQQLPLPLNELNNHAWANPYIKPDDQFAQHWLPQSLSLERRIFWQFDPQVQRNSSETWGAGYVKRRKGWMHKRVC